MRLKHALALDWLLDIFLVTGSLFFMANSVGIKATEVILFHTVYHLAMVIFIYKRVNKKHK